MCLIQDEGFISALIKIIAMGSLYGLNLRRRLFFACHRVFLPIGFNNYCLSGQLLHPAGAPLVFISTKRTPEKNFVG